MTTTAADRTAVEQRFNAAMDVLGDVLLDAVDDAAYDEAQFHVNGLRAVLCRALGGHDMVADQCGRPEHAACITCGEPAVAAHPTDEEKGVWVVVSQSASVEGDGCRSTSPTPITRSSTSAPRTSRTGCGN